MDKRPRVSLKEVMKTINAPAFTTQKGQDVCSVSADEAMEFAVDSEGAREGTVSDIPVDYDLVDVEPVVVPVITDIHGRLSDRVEALEHETGLSVIPLEMANIAPEVESLKRHEIFDFMQERFAFSPNIRNDVIAGWKEKITAHIASGLNFEENLVTSVTYDGKTYKTLSLSRVEWTMLLSMFRNFKQGLVVRNQNLILCIAAEHVI